MANKAITQFTELTAPSATDVLAIVDVAGDGSTKKIKISKLVGGTDTQVQFNDGGILGGSPLFLFNKNNNSVYLGAEADAGLVRGVSATTSDTDGGEIDIVGGYGNGTGNGGVVELAGGLGGTSGNGGDVLINGGPSGGSGELGNILLGFANQTDTTRNGDFVYIPTTNGTPTGTPASYGGLVPLVFDTADNKLYIYNGGWKSVTLT